MKEKMILKGLGVVIAVIGGFIIILLLTLGSLYIGGFFKQVNMDINREVTQHSQQYIETKRSLLLSLIADAESAQGGQKIAIVNRFCEEYSYVDFDVPSDVHSYAARNCT
jgi:hypothetical protein